MYLLLGLAVLNVLSSAWSYIAGRSFDKEKDEKINSEYSTKL